uniref:Testis expressed 36 n=1 Tax=Ursus maritimus TaxID=29073 RepID=A0A452TG50_URSMA
MAKGRRFNPALDKDGRWFPQIGLTQKTPESSTSAMLKEPHRPHSSWQVEGKLPPIYKAREKVSPERQPGAPVPVALHGRQPPWHFWPGLGRRKISPEKRQHVSRNFNLWACDYVPSCLDGFSNNQISYVYQEVVVVPIFRRFPRRYNEIWNSFKFIPQRSYTEFLKKNPKVRFAIDRKKVIDEFCNIGIALNILKVHIFWFSPTS